MLALCQEPTSRDKERSQKQILAVLTFAVLVQHSSSDRTAKAKRRGRKRAKRMPQKSRAKGKARRRVRAKARAKAWRAARAMAGVPMPRSCFVW